jgi:uncharacterized protein (DUF1330 family)
MPAFFVADVEVLDPEAFKAYAAGAPPTVAQYGGKYIARGGAIEPLEGGWTPKRLTIIQFDSVARCKEWFNSPEYKPFRDLRGRVTKAKLLVTEGL